MTDSSQRVLLLHGLGADRRAFQRFARLLPSEWDVHAVDLLGHGDAPKPDHGYSLENHAKYVASVIVDTFGSDAETNPPSLVGHSYGAATSVATAALFPRLVRDVVLLDAIAPTDDSNAATDRGTKTGRMIEARRTGNLAATVDEMFSDQSEALRRWTVETWSQMALGVVDELDGNWPRFASDVHCDVTIVHGDLELGGGGDLPADWFDNPTVVRIAGAGHYLHATHARETAAAVTEAIERATA
jgi:pimeloyl-ACP methyl ester carboxylesterase